MTPIRRAWKLHHQFRRAMSSHRDVPSPPIDGERLLFPYTERQSPQGRDTLADKRPGEMLAAAWLRKLCSTAPALPDAPF